MLGPELPRLVSFGRPRDLLTDARKQPRPPTQKKTFAIMPTQQYRVSILCLQALPQAYSLQEGPACQPLCSRHDGKPLEFGNLPFKVDTNESQGDSAKSCPNANRFQARGGVLDHRSHVLSIMPRKALLDDV